MAMRLKYEHKGGEVPYLLDCGDGNFAESSMPAPVADEIARRSKTAGESGREGYGLAVDGGIMFPVGMFRDDSQAEPEEPDGGAPAAKPKAPSGGKRCRR